MTNAPMNLYDWFANAARRYAKQPALEVGTEVLTYRDLEDLAVRLADRMLTMNGGQPPKRVGVLANRSVATYVGYLAALRAGATVVPLNPDAPQARNQVIAEQARLELVVVDKQATLACGTPLLTAEPTELAFSPIRTLSRRGPCSADPEDIAYILFTSGSTGAPKGVPVLHRNIGAYLSHVTSRYGIGPGSRLSQAFELTFDGSVHDMFVAWAHGGTLVVPARSQLMTPVRFINSRRLTHWFSVPSLISFASRLGTLKPASMPTLRWSVFGGEPLTMSQARAWKEAAPHSAMENLYGPTETTIACTSYRLPSDPGEWPSTANNTVPIGTCHPTIDHLVLDEHGRPSDTGELCVRGPQRFPGYLEASNDIGSFLSFAEDGTALAYTGDAPLGEAHWYRTGDRVTRTNGQLLHLGRTDQQVKVRGHRVELGEIEGPLREQDGVRDAVALAVNRPDGTTDVIAAVSGTGCDVEHLYDSLRARLPEYMIPRRITALEELPLNAHGKIDRRAVLTSLERRDEWRHTPPRSNA